MSQVHDQLARRFASHFSQLPQVEAIALGGSVAAGRANAGSDIDLYIFPSEDLSPDLRLSIGREFSPDAQVIDNWGPAIVWFDPETGIEVEALFFNTRWMEDLVLRPLEQFQAQMGYTTSFWYTMKICQPLFDRNGWLARMQAKAAQPYPPELVQAIIKLNYPLLRGIYTSYRAQIASAINRDDLYVIQRNVSAFLASYFDILFALNRVPHPGVKRILNILDSEGLLHPPHMREQVTRLLQLSGSSSGDIVGELDRIVDELDALLKSEGLH